MNPLKKSLLEKQLKKEIDRSMEIIKKHVYIVKGARKKLKRLEGK